MTDKDEVMLNTWERNILRVMYGPVTGQVVWGIRTNQELKELCKTPDLIVDIERRRLAW
jgi:hypothetical protein